MRVDGKSTRRHERIKRHLPLHVRYRESAEYEWEATTRISELTQHGAGFELNRPVETSRLIHLALPMPRELRAFGHQEGQYSVWAIIRYIRMLQSETVDRIQINVGTAFIGKDPPPGFLRDPTTHYDLKPIPTRDGLWVARERPRHAGRFALPKEARQTVAASILVETVNELGEITGRDEAETQNVSEHGAAILTSLTTACGRFVRLTSKHQGLSLLAVVRGCHQVEAGGASLLNLEFVCGKWSL